MTDRSIVRMATIVVGLSGLSYAVPAAAISDLSCSARQDTASVSPRPCAAGSRLDVTPGPGICVGATARWRPAAASIFPRMMMQPAHPNLCLKANASAPLSHLALQAEP